MASKPTLSDLFLALHDRLACELGITRRTIGHTGTMGTVSEGQWIKMLYEHLPKRYKVNRAFVIDSNGACSDQIDIVIHDRQFSPFVLNYGEALYVPAESVYAAIEVKQCLNDHNLEYAMNKIASVRKLNRTSVQFTANTGRQSPTAPKPILGGIVALESDWSPPFGAPLSSLICSSDEDHRLNIGCTARDGVFEVNYESTETDIKILKSSAPLALFLLRLIDALRTMGTAPAMSIEDYTRCITQESEIDCQLTYFDTSVLADTLENEDEAS